MLISLEKVCIKKIVINNLDGYWIGLVSIFVLYRKTFS